MILSEIVSKTQIEACVEMYLSFNDYTFLPADKDLAIRNFSLAVRRKKFTKLLIDNDSIVAFLWAEPGNSFHINERILQQQYYCSTLTGVKAFKAVKLLHEDLLIFAKKNHYSLVFSPGSHMDEKYVFTRMLEKLGWQRRGHIAYKRPD